MLTPYRSGPARTGLKACVLLRDDTDVKEPACFTLNAGDVRASREPMALRTVLGSCVAACLYDPQTRIGGMNHMLLPGRARIGDTGQATRYGIHAMELLINAIMQLGGGRRRLRAKVFGAVHALDISEGRESVAEKNGRFVLDFLETEGIPVVARRLGGRQPLVVTFHTDTAKALVKALPAAAARQVVAAERHSARLQKQQFESTVEMF